MGRPSVLAVVFERDMTVNPEPNKAFARQLGFEVVEIPGDCGHGSNPECYQQQVISASRHSSEVLIRHSSNDAMRIGAKSRQYYCICPRPMAADHYPW